MGQADSTTRLVTGEGRLPFANVSRLLQLLERGDREGGRGWWRYEAADNGGVRMMMEDVVREVDRLLSAGTS